MSALHSIERFQSYLRQSQSSEPQPWLGASELVDLIAGELLAACSDRGNRTNLQEVADLLRVEVVCRAKAPGIYGKLWPKPGGFVATVYERSYGDPAEADGKPLNGFPDDSFGRFTLAHELGHTLFYSLPRSGADTPRRLVPPVARGSQQYAREEGLCHRFASSLLLPERVREQVPDRPSLRFLVEASAAAAVGLDCFSRRILHDWSLWSRVAIVQLSAFGSGVKASVWRGTSVRRDRSIPTRSHLLSAIGARWSDETYLNLTRSFPTQILGTYRTHRRILAIMVPAHSTRGRRGGRKTVNATF